MVTFALKKNRKEKTAAFIEASTEEDMHSTGERQLSELTLANCDNLSRPV